MTAVLPEALRVKRFPRRTRSRVECLRAAVMFWLAGMALGPAESLRCYAIARNGKRDFWDAMHGLLMVEEALVRNLRQARRMR
jgi:hypothetical protein